MPELAVPPSNTREGVVSIFCPSYGALPLGADVNVASSQFGAFKKSLNQLQPLWVRRVELNHRPSPYEGDELPLLYSAWLPELDSN